jgi:hypothetical protein
MCRVDPNTFNYLITDTSLISAYATQNAIDNERQNLIGMTFDPDTPEGGDPAENAVVRFNFSNYNRWEYDEESGRYLRFQDEANDENGSGETFEPLMDGLTNEQIAADNVVILFATHNYAFGTRVGPGEIIQIEFAGPGKAFALRDGQIYQLTWVRPESDDVISLTFPDGTPYPFKPGNTWYQVVGTTSTSTDEGDGSFRFQFSIP